MGVELINFKSINMQHIANPITQRRLRTSTHMRELTATVRLHHKNFIQPLFIDEGIAAPRTVTGLTEVQIDTIDTVLQTVEDCVQSGVTKFLLFPVPANKALLQFDFSFACAVIKKIKERFNDAVWIAADLCLCSYTTHGHCGILNEAQTKLSNNKTVDVLCNYAAQLAVAGADCIAPSDMMDGRIAAIRTTLDALQYDTVSIMSYAAKFSSQFYGPFRDACHSAPAAAGLHNRKTYQLSPLHINAAVAAAQRDDNEGADIVMVKPAALYADVIKTIKEHTLKPVAAYHVSGEYAAIELLAQHHLVQRAAAHLEVWIALQRSGADIIISYAAKHAKQWIEDMEY
jgi:porphobilinogen synthase